MKKKRLLDSRKTKCQILFLTHKTLTFFTPFILSVQGQLFVHQSWNRTSSLLALALSLSHLLCGDYGWTLCIFFWDLLSISVSGHCPCPEDCLLLNILCNHSSIHLLVHPIFHSTIAVWSHPALLFMCTCIVCPFPLGYKYHKGRDLVFLGNCYDPRDQNNALPLTWYSVNIFFSEKFKNWPENRPT